MWLSDLCYYIALKLIESQVYSYVAYKCKTAHRLAEAGGLFIVMVAPPRIELGTQGFSVPCSTY